MNRGVWGLLRSLGEMLFRLGPSGENVGPRRRLRLDDTPTVEFALTDNPDGDEVIVSAAVGDLSGTYALAVHDHDAADIVSGTLGLIRGGTGAALSDPGADRILFWDDSAAVVTWLTAGSGLSITGTTITATGTGLSDGDKGDITVSSSGTVWTIDNDAVTYAKIQDVSATDRLLGRSTAGAGVIEEITCTAAGRQLLDDVSFTDMRTTLNLTIGTQVQAWDTLLDSIATLADPNADRILFWDDSAASFAWLTAGSGLSISGTTLTAVVTDGDKGDITVSSTGTVWEIDAGVVTTTELGGDITTAGKALLDDASASDQRTTLGLGTIAIQAASNVTITGGSITGITDLAVADGGTGASTASGARTNLGLVIGTDVQAFDAFLDDIAALTDPNADRILFWDDSAGEITWLTVGAINSGLVVSGTTLSAATADDSTPGVLATATQAAMESASDLTTIVTPGRTGFHPGVAKGWVDFTGTGTIASNASHNVSGLTDNGTGDYTVSWSADFSSANYCVLCGGQYIEDDGAGGAARGVEVARTTNAKVAGSVRVRSVEYFSPFGVVDFRRVFVAGFGDQ